MAPPAARPRLKPQSHRKHRPGHVPPAAGPVAHQKRRPRVAPSPIEQKLAKVRALTAARVGSAKPASVSAPSTLAMKGRALAATRGSATGIANKAVNRKPTLPTLSRTGKPAPGSKAGLASMIAGRGGKPSSGQTIRQVGPGVLSKMGSGRKTGTNGANGDTLTVNPPSTRERLSSIQSSLRLKKGSR